MGRSTYRILRILITICLFSLFFNFFTFLALPLVTYIPSEDNLFQAYAILVTFFGLHSILALGTFVSSRLSFSYNFRYFLLLSSILAPVMYLLAHAELFISLDISNLVLSVVIIIFTDFMLRDIRKNIVKRYISILIDPFYLEEDYLY